MSQSARLIGRVQKFHAGQFPATVKLGAQSYEAGTGGLSRGSSLVNGSFIAIRRITFWVPRAAFIAAGQPEPQGAAPVQCSAPAALAGAYTIETVRVDGAGVNLLLACTAPAQ